MQAIQVGKFKSDFSNILKQVEQNGEKFIIEYGKKQQKIAIIIPYDPSFEKEEERQFGIYKNRGSFKFEKDFSMNDEELLGL